MAKLTPEEAAVKQANRLKASVEDMRRGIQRVSTSPTAQAAAQKDKMRQRLIESLDSGKWEKNLKAVSLDEWKTRAADVGVNRVAAGIDAVKDKQVDFYSKLLPAVDAAQRKVQSMPSTTLEDNIQRMVTFTREMSKFKK